MERDKNSRHVYGGGTGRKAMSRPCYELSDRGKRLPSGKKGVLSCNPQIFFAEQTAPAAEYGIGIRMENAKGELLTFNGTERNFAVADIAGSFANGDVYLAGQTNTLLVRSGNKLVYSGSTEGLWSWKADNGETAYFLFLCGCCKRDQPPEGCRSGL